MADMKIEGVVAWEAWYRWIDALIAAKRAEKDRT